MKLFKIILSIKFTWNVQSIACCWVTQREANQNFEITGVFFLGLLYLSLEIHLICRVTRAIIIYRDNKHQGKFLIRVLHGLDILHVLNWFFLIYKLIKKQINSAYCLSLLILFNFMLKAKIVQILFLQIHQHYAKFHSWWNNHCLSDRKYNLNKNVLHMHNFSEEPMKKWAYFKKKIYVIHFDI
jgi:hypothetical protein